MDTLAHGLWAIALGKSGRTRTPWWALAIVGAGPDLVWLPFTFLQLVSSGTIYFFQGPYNISHSLVVWLGLTLIATIKWRRAIFYTWPWALHIVIDIPGHLDMYTPIFWPISNYKIPGAFDWLSWKFFVGTYIALAIIFLFLFLRRRKSLRS